MIQKTMRVDGGVETSVSSLSNALTHIGHDVYIAALCNEGGLDISTRLDIPLNRMIYLGPIASPLSYVKKILKIRKIIRSLKIDIVHTHLFHAGLVGRVACVGIKVATVATEHSTFYDWWDWRHYLIDKLLAKHTSAHIAVSRSAAATLAARTGILPNTIHVVHNTADNKRFEYREKSLLFQKDTINILLIGRLEYSKNIIFALKVAKNIITINPRIRFFISGSGSQEESLRIVSKNEGLDAFVNFVSLTSDMPKLMSQMDLLLLSSHWEGCPMCIIESYSIGLPVVATAVPGVIDIVHDRVTGVLLEPGDIDGSSKKILEVINDPKYASTLISGARSHVNIFSPDTTAHKILQIYDSVRCV